MRAILQKLCILGVLVASFSLMATSSPAQAATPLNKIRSNATMLYDGVTGQQFKLRGANYVRLSQGATGGTYHSTFEPGKYNLAAVRAFFAQMEHDKYNTVRVLIDPGSTDAANPHGIGRGMGTNDPVYGPYMDNVASFVNEAAVRGIYVLPSLDVFPQNSYYWDIVAAKIAGVGTPNMDGRNLSYMDKGRIAAKAEYMKQFSSALIQRIGEANKTAILAYQSDNEVFFEANKAPFHQLSGTVTPVDGKTYDMSNAAQRQQAADASMVVYSHLIKRELLKSDPEALMTIGYFTNRAVGKTSFNGLMTYCSTNCQPSVDYRVPGRPLSMTVFGLADFVDLHIYPNTASYSPTSDLNGMEKPQFRKPYIIGEMGARKSVYSNNLTTAAYAMRDFRVATCQQGAQGWLFWTWDTYENLANQDLFFRMTENRGAINGQMAPIAQPNPCSPLRQFQTVLPRS